MSGTVANSSFSQSTPSFQWAIDSTSLGEAKTCPRKYYYSIVRGLQPRNESPHLTFGILLHSARELYERAKLEGLDHDEALDKVLDWALCATWDRELSRPWSSGHAQKNRKTLIQTIVWYLDAMGQNDSLETLILANGRPAVELSFRFDSGIRMGGETVVFCGHLDRIATLNGVPYVADIKTTTSEPTPRWAQQFTPGNQFSLYALAGKVAFGQELEGVIVDGVQVGVGFARFGRFFVPRDPLQLDEWLQNAEYWISQMYRWALRNEWPMNDKSCQLYGGCPFQTVCSRSPVAREGVIAQDYTARVWDPLQTREN